MDRATVRSVILLVAVAALLSAAGVAAAQGGSSTQARHDQALDRGRTAGLFGTFTYDEAERGQVRGDFAAFDVDPTTGTLHDYEVDWDDRTLQIFDSVTFAVDGEPVTTERIGPDGPYWGYTSDEVGLMTYDRPHGTTMHAQIGSDGGTLTLDLAEGVTAELARSENPARVILTGSHEASPMCQPLATGNLADVSVGEDTVTFTFDGEGRLIFTIDPPNAGEEEILLRRALDEAIVQGELASSVSVTGVEGTPAQLVQPSKNGFSMARQAGDGYVRAEVMMPEDRQPLHLSIDRQLSSGNNPFITFDGERVQIVDNVDEVLNGSDTVESQGFILDYADTIEVVISPGVPDFSPGVPDFSPRGVSMHTITITDDESRSNPWPPMRAENPIRSGIGLSEHVRQAAADQAQRRSMIHDQTLQDGLDRAREAGVLAATEGRDWDSGEPDIYFDTPSEGSITNLAYETGDGKVTLLAELAVEGFTPAQGEGADAVELAGEGVTVDVADAPGASTSITAGDSPAKVTLELPVGDDGTPPGTLRVSDGAMLLDYEEGVGVLAEAAGDTEIVPGSQYFDVHLGPNAAVEFSWSPDADAVEDGPWESTETGATYRTSPSGANFVIGIRGSLAPGADTVGGGMWTTGGDGAIRFPQGWSDWIAPAGGSMIPGGWSHWAPAGPQVGAEARLVAAGNQAVGSVTTGSVGVTPGAADETSVSASIESNAPNPKFVGFLVPKEDLNGTSASGVSVTMDGLSVDEEPADEMRRGLVRGDAYAAADAGDAVHVLLQVESFSEHDVTISGDGDAGLGAPGFGLLAVVGALGAAATLAGRRR